MEKIKGFYQLFWQWIFHPEFFYWYARKNAMAIAEKYVKGVLLDIGCGEMPFKKKLLPKVEFYFGLDYPPGFEHSATLRKKTCMNVIAAGEKLPVKNDAVDTVLLLDVLEHTKDFRSIMNAASNALKAGGHIITTTPFLYPVHMEPTDFFRYTDSALFEIGSGISLEAKLILPYGNFWHTFALLLNNFIFFDGIGLNRIAKPGTKGILKTLLLLLLPFCLSLFTLVNSVCFILGRSGISKHFPLGYIAIFSKGIER